MDISPETLLKLLSDPTRSRCLMLLLAEGELCVCELTFALDDIQPKISRHLAVLRDARVVLDERKGQWIHYRLNPRLPDWAKELLTAVAKGAKEQKHYRDDLKKLRQMPNRPGSRICA
jgi:ArsR family transcriptional regulator